MKKSALKRIIACLVFCALTAGLIAFANDVLLYKNYNRYYMLRQELARLDEEYDVQVFGACHSYTSFQARYFEETYGLTSYVMGGPGEIFPVTWLHMLERFEEDVPEVALVEIWGIHAYETYDTREKILGYYLQPNVELFPFSAAKAEVIRDFDTLDMVLENFPIAKYKDRLIEGDLTGVDFNYSFEGVCELTSDYDKEEMSMRFANNGFCVMPMWHDDPAYDPYIEVLDFDERQPDVAEDDLLELEADMLKYVEKIIALCEEKGVELIFYRAPYLSKENELRKTNWFARYCAERNVLFLDLEKEMTFDLETDFLDYHHLNETGALKATDYLASYILKALE